MTLSRDFEEAERAYGRITIDARGADRHSVAQLRAAVLREYPRSPSLRERSFQHFNKSIADRDAAGVSGEGVDLGRFGFPVQLAGQPSNGEFRSEVGLGGVAPDPEDHSTDDLHKGVHLSLENRHAELDRGFFGQGSSIVHGASPVLGWPSFHESRSGGEGGS